MKDTAISFDVVHHQQHQQQHQSWSHQRQHQHQTHTTNVYANQTNQHNAPNSQSQRPNVNHHPQQGQHGSEIDQYHQQLQSTAHHNSAAAYYQQAHLYSSYQPHGHSQDQQRAQQHQHSASDQHGHHHSINNPVGSGAQASVVGTGVGGGSHQHAGVHQQQSSNSHSTALNHSGWSSGVGTLAPQSHHAVVTDHSTLAYMTHAYQSHNSSVNDHHRDSNGPLSSQAIGAGHQPSTYSVDSLYNSPATAAAVAAYGYNNYNTAFFQTSNGGPHSQTGHPSPNISTFWNQTNPHRTPHAQPVTEQAPVQQRQPIVSEQTTNYLHDPRMYYGRPTYGQGLQNFGQPHHHSQTQPQADALHQRMSTISQQHQLLQTHHEQQLHQTAHQQINQQSSQSNQQQISESQSQQDLLCQAQHSNQVVAVSNQEPLTQGLSSKHNQSYRATPPHQKQLNSSDDLPKSGSQAGSDIDQLPANKPSSPHQSAVSNSQQTSKTGVSNAHGLQAVKLASKEQTSSHHQATNNSPSVNRNQNVIDGESSAQYRRNGRANPQNSSRNNFRNQNDERMKNHSGDPSSRVQRDEESRPNVPEISKDHSSPDHITSVESGIAALSLSTARKTTWASIASQPAKISQPKSLKSKIASSNSVLSSSKHLAAVNALDSSNLDSKNGINSAIKSGVTATTTSLQRSSIPPPIAKLTAAAAASLKLNLLDDGLETSKISWPAVNASINLSLDDPIIKEPKPIQESERPKKSELFANRDYRDHPRRDHNHNQGLNSRITNSYGPPHESNRDNWSRRGERDLRVRRESDRREVGIGRQNEMNEEGKEPLISRRGYKSGGMRRNEESYRDRDLTKRMDSRERGDIRINDRDFQSRVQNSRYDGRETNQALNAHGDRPNEAANKQHHHYSNLRGGSTEVILSKPDLNQHPHLNPANFNPTTFNLEPMNARYFIIKSYSEDDIHRSIKYSIWCSTNHGNKRLDEAYRQQQAKEGPLYLFFSVNGSGHFCGMAQMMSSVDFDSSSGVWAQNKWQGEFTVKWIYVKDVPNSALRHITLENNEDKPVTNSRDTQEVPSEKGKAVLKIIHQYTHTTSLFDDFLHYERKQEEEKMKKTLLDSQPSKRSEDRERGGSQNARYPRPYGVGRPANDFPTNRERPSRYVPAENRYKMNSRH